MFCILVIGDLLSFKVPLPLLLYLRGGGILQERYESVTIMILLCTLSLICLIYKNYKWASTDRITLPWGTCFNLFCKIDQSPCKPLLKPPESMRLGTLGTNPHQQPSNAWQVNRCLVILNLPCSWWSCRLLNFRNQYFAVEMGECSVT
jgi:hypothetical protein